MSTPRVCRMEAGSVRVGDHVKCGDGFFRPVVRVEPGKRVRSIMLIHGPVGFSCFGIGEEVAVITEADIAQAEQEEAS